MKDPGEPCRLCMGRSDGIDIFPSGEPSELANIIAYSVGIKVKASDARLTLCEQCCSKVKDFYDFKLICQKTESEFGPAYQSPSKQTAGCVKIKKEPGTEDSTSPISKAGVTPLPFKPSESWPQGGMVIYATVNQNGQMVPVQAMVPVGEPIPFPLGMPMIPPILPVLPTSAVSVPQQVSLVTPKEEPQESETNTIALIEKSEPALQETATPTQAVETEIVSSWGKPANATAGEDSDDDLNEVLEQVHTDVEDEDEDNVLPPEIPASSRENQHKKTRAGPKSSKLKRKGGKGKTSNNQESSCSKAVTPRTISVKRPREEEDSDLDSSIKSSKTDTPGSRSMKNSRKEEDSYLSSNKKSKTVSPMSTMPPREEEDLGSNSESGRIRRKTRGMYLKESEESKKKATEPSTPCSRPTRSCVANQRRIIDDSEDSDEVAFDVDSDSDSAFSNKNMSSSESEWDDLDNDASDKFHRVQKLSHSPQFTGNTKKNTEVDNKSGSNGAEDSKPTFKCTKQLQCKFCPRTFRSDQYLKCHEETHRTVKRFTCMKCDQNFSSRSVLERHEETNHVNETWECRPCFVAFAQIKTWRSHVKRHKSYPRETVVSVSEEKVIKLEEIETVPEMDYSDKKTPVKPGPKKNFFEKPSLSEKTKKRKFYSTVSEEEEDVDCPDSIDDPDSVDNLDSVYNPDSVDNLDFVDEIDSADGIVGESQKKDTCTLCDVVFDDAAALLEHMVKTHQKPRGPPFACKYCDRPFQDKGALICHETEHRPTPDPKNIKCRFCDIEFTSLSDKICHEEISHRK